MIETGMDIRETDYAGRNIFTYASMHNENPKLINYLVKKGLSVRQTDSNGNTLAHYAACNPNPEIMQTLIDFGVPFDMENEQEFHTPLDLSALYGYVDVCRVLLEYGSRLEHRDADGCTPLLLATKNKNPEVLSFLFKD